MTSTNGESGWREPETSEVTETTTATVKCVESKYRIEVRWVNVVGMVALHGLALGGIYAYWTQCRVQTVLFYYLLTLLSGMGVTAGAHRLWSHRAYRATPSLRIALMCLHSGCLQNSLYVWCRDHRVHHRFSETDADPHNSRRGFFFAHMGWLLCAKHPEVKRKGKSVDCSDLMADPVVNFQYRHFVPLALLFGFALPILIPVCAWHEQLHWATLINFYRLVYILHNTWLVNSWAHLYGMRHYDTSINPSETQFVAIQSFGEGYHNYHHTFPHDYSASEFDWRLNFNFTTLFIDLLATLGFVYDRRKVAPCTVQQRIQRTGEWDKRVKHKRALATDRLRYTVLPWTLVTFHLWGPLLARMI